MDRRLFLNSLTFSAAGLALSPNSLPAFDAAGDNTAKGSYFDQLTKRLLADWCDGMIRRQINQPDNPALHGALACPSCEHIHGRCSDAMYPFMHMASVTGDKKYLQAAIDVFEWANANVTNDDGSWRNDIRPKAWRGTTVFGAIALAEALHYHGKLLDQEQRKAWMERLDRAVGGYLYKDFKTIDFTNLNYGMTAIYGFYLFGKTLNNQKYTDRGLQFVKRVKEFFTEPNTLLWGEGKPNNNLSGRGLLPVDLGYNVEESLNGVVLYAIDANDTELLNLATKSLAGHLEFMLPDGAWDNSWGTRSQKWSYWGSRTSDGCQPGFSLLAGYNPAFGTAAIRNAELLERCTAEGLLHGGPHYVSHGVKPCIHHTFAHAKVMALVQDRMHSMPKVDTATRLPRETAVGVKHFPELDVWLAAQGPWRATVSAYDSIYKTKKADHLQQPTGGSMSVLYHNKVGTLLAGSMARYIMVEPLNMQPRIGEDIALTPRVEIRKDGRWYTNLYDLKAEVTFEENDTQIAFNVKAMLQDEDRNVVPDDVAPHAIHYRFDDDLVTMKAQATDKLAGDSQAVMVVPILSPTGEDVRQVSDNHLEIDKPGGTVVVKSNVPMSIGDTDKNRVFNMVPGAEAVVVSADLKDQADGVEIRISVS